MDGRLRYLQPVKENNGSLMQIITLLNMFFVVFTKVNS